MVAFPALKLLAVAIRQVSKPIAQNFQKQAKNHEGFRQVCIGLAQGWHRAEQTVVRKFYDKDMSKATIPPLNEQKAIDAGATILGESIIFAIAGGVLYAEHRRTSAKDAEKERKRQADLDRLQKQIDQLQAENDRILKKVFPKEEHEREEIPEYQARKGWGATLWGYVPAVPSVSIHWGSKTTPPATPETPTTPPTTTPPTSPDAHTPVSPTGPAVSPVTNGNGNGNGSAQTQTPAQTPTHTHTPSAAAVGVQVAETPAHTHTQTHTPTQTQGAK